MIYIILSINFQINLQMAINQEFKNYIDRICYDYRVSQAEVAQQSGLNPTYLSQIMNGKRPFTEKTKDKIEIAFPTPSYNQNVENSVVHGNVHQDNRKYYSDSPDVLKAQIDTLERAIQDKEEQVRTLTEQVRTLTEQVRTLTSSLAKKDEQISKLIEKIK